jgi:hypothetical protein
MNNKFHFSFYAIAILIAVSLGCTPKGNVLAQKAKKDSAANTVIVKQMKSRIFNIGIKLTSNTISEVLSNITKSARLIENEIGRTVSIETGFPVLLKNQASLKQGQDNEGDTFSNTFKYKTLNDILWVRIHTSELNTGSTNVEMTFSMTTIGSKGNNIRHLPPKFTQSIYEKLWSAIEKELGSQLLPV